MPERTFRLKNNSLRNIGYISCVTHANDVPGLHRATPEPREETLARLAHTINRMRRIVTRPPAGGVVISALGRHVDLAKIVACEAVSDLSLVATPVTVSDVAAALVLDRSTVSRLMGECETDGLVHRVRLNTDARRVGLELTADGQAVIAESMHERGRFLGFVTQGFNEPDLENFVALLERFADSVTTGLDQWLTHQATCTPAVYETSTESKASRTTE